MLRVHSKFIGTHGSTREVSIDVSHDILPISIFAIDPKKLVGESGPVARPKAIHMLLMHYSAPGEISPLEGVPASVYSVDVDKRYSYQRVKAIVWNAFPPRTIYDLRAKRITGWRGRMEVTYEDAAWPIQFSKISDDQSDTIIASPVPTVASLYGDDIRTFLGCMAHAAERRKLFCGNRLAERLREAEAA